MRFEKAAMNLAARDTTPFPFPSLFPFSEVNERTPLIRRQTQHSRHKHRSTAGGEGSARIVPWHQSQMHSCASDCISC